MDLSRVLEELQAARDEAADQLAELNERRDVVVSELEKIDQMIRAGRGPRARKASAGAAPASAEVVEAVMTQAREYAQQDGPASEIVRGTFTRAMVVQDLNLHPSSVDKALRQLRDSGKIRQAGRKRLGDSHRASNLLVLADQ